MLGVTTDKTILSWQERFYLSEPWLAIRGIPLEVPIAWMAHNIQSPLWILLLRNSAVGREDLVEFC